jgi:hypothetical protein
MQSTEEQLRDLLASALAAIPALDSVDGCPEDRAAATAAIRETDALITHLDSNFRPSPPYGGLIETEV